MRDGDLLSGTPIVVPLGGHAKWIALSDNGVVWVVAIAGHGRWVAALDDRGHELSRVSLGPLSDATRRTPGGSSLRVADDGSAWVDADGQLLRVAPDGTVLASLGVGEPDDEVLGFLLLPDGFIVSLHKRHLGEVPPRIIRVGTDGAVRWRTDLPQANLGPPNQAVWHTQHLLVSGSSLLASFQDDDHGMCRSICLDLESGTVRWQTGAGPQHSQTILGPDRFLIGWYGYGDHHMVAFDPAGLETQRWEHHAWVVVGPDEIPRGPETENQTSAFSRFHPDGRVERGEPLEAWYTAYPALTASGWTVFHREDEHLVAVDPAGVKHRVWAGEPRERYADTRIVLGPTGTVMFGIGGQLCIVPTSLGPLADGPWPCGGLNLRNNPVAL